MGASDRVHIFNSSRPPEGGYPDSLIATTKPPEDELRRMHGIVCLLLADGTFDVAEQLLQASVDLFMEQQQAADDGHGNVDARFGIMTGIGTAYAKNGQHQDP
ncbi:hypothetical protein H257_12340 [Aphanomyces astaci]|uniref:Uncharacterized protein n=1 Tax=Aphanomyces astaci TaxID=112090 RepID=W4G000_APHAT|nr:hypothetical protein H257_12340 [Aphanomyces astaci]ETV72576.1 hypothetical protein H257_12340 [Aphanomyces astaci]|eukprot:XP_009837804.1 hypothetical protein H257_12340 [Aphanomyces astaci]